MNTEREAFHIERALIKKIRKCSEEYNVADGGEGCGRSNAPLPDDARERLRERGLKNKDKFAQYSHLGPKASSKKVVCLNTGATYESASEAARANDISRSLIIEVCGRNSRRKTAGGLVFRYFGDHLGGLDEANNAIKLGGRRNKNKKERRIISETDNMTFGSASECSVYYKISRHTIARSCAGNSLKSGRKFTYLDGWCPNPL